MPTIENFYWILFKNLLEPAGLDCWYYHPFGTTNTMSQGEYRGLKYDPKHEHHVLFHFDQEPLWSSQLLEIAKYNLGPPSWSAKLLKILANSEKSDLKREICRARNMMDWYFFYHGFAALDWYNDVRYVSEIGAFTRIFSSFNHLVTHHRSYRMALTARFLQSSLESSAHISFHANALDCEIEISSPYSRLPEKDKLLIQRYLSPRSLPIICDSTAVNGNFSAHLGYHEYRFWQDSFLHVVNETVFYEPKLHLTEKIFKPIVALRPFVLVGAPGNLEYLRSYGFQTFSPWIDESYDNESDPSRRLDMIAAEVQKLCGRSMSELRFMHEEMRPILEYNKNHFFGRFRQLIVDELVDNFETCLRIWNNGRVDGRERPLPGDLAAVKQVLLR